MFDIANESIKFDLYYLPDNNSLRLCYGFEKEFTVDAADRKALDKYGYEFDVKESYADVEGKWYEDIANTLRQYGNYFEGNEFKGEQNVTGKDVIEFFFRTTPENYIENYNVSDTYKEFAENPDKEVTKYDMARVMAKRIADNKILNNGEFVRPFSDVSDENINYVAVCKAYGIAKGVNGIFNGDKTITRAEMAAMLYYSL